MSSKRNPSATRVDLRPRRYYDAFEADYITEDMAAQNRKVARNLRHLERTGKVLDKNFAPEDVKQAMGTTDGGEIHAEAVQ